MSMNVTPNNPNPAPNIANKKLPQQQPDTGGVIFGEGTLKNIEVKEVLDKDCRGVFQTYKEYKAKLTDGTQVEYRKQDEKRESQIIRNADGSIDFVGLKEASITETPKKDVYNLIGCEFTKVDTRSYSNKHNSYDDDTVRIANREHNGEVEESREIFISYGKGDRINTYKHNAFAYHKDNIGNIDFRDFENFTEREYIEYGRVKSTKVVDGKETVEYRSHDDKKLDPGYVEGSNKKLADGYTIRTSPDGKKQWFFAPDGSLISKQKFLNRDL